MGSLQNICCEAGATTADTAWGGIALFLTYDAAFRSVPTESCVLLTVKHRVRPLLSRGNHTNPAQSMSTLQTDEQAFRVVPSTVDIPVTSKWNLVPEVVLKISLSWSQVRARAPTSNTVCCKSTSVSHAQYMAVLVCVVI